MGWDAIGVKHGTNKASTDVGYLDVYEQLLAHKTVESVIEFGVYEGASLRTWREIWPDAGIVGVDVNGMPDVAGVVQIQGDCTDRMAMTERSVLKGPFDVIIDDASHQLDDIIRTFNIFSPRLHVDGLYIIEDTLIEPGGSYAHTGELVDLLHAYGERPVVIVPGKHHDEHAGKPIDDQGPWALVVVAP